MVSIQPVHFHFIYTSLSLCIISPAKTSTSDEKHNGSLQSPNYPGPYALNGDVYIYTIYSPGKYIRLKFDGYDLSGQSTIQVGSCALIDMAFTLYATQQDHMDGPARTFHHTFHFVN